MDIVTKIVNAIVNPALIFIGALAVLLFLWGVFQLIYKAEDPDARKTGKDHLIYGVFGIFVIVSVFSIINSISAFVNK